MATSTIKNNEELVFELTEGHFEHVIGLLLAITTNHPESDSHDVAMTEFNPLGIVVLDGIEIKWSPKGAEKLLDFLNASVCVAGRAMYTVYFIKCAFTCICILLAVTLVTEHIVKHN